MRARQSLGRQPCGSTGSWTNASPPRSEHARELAQVARTTLAGRQVLQDEVADERVGDPVLDAVEPLPGDGAELDVRRGHVRPRPLEHRRARRRARPPGRTAPRARRSSARGRSRPRRRRPPRGSAPSRPNSPASSLGAGRRVADVDGGVGARERVPRAAHLHARRAYPPVSDAKRQSAVLRPLLRRAGSLMSAHGRRRRRPRGPYSLALSARHAGDATRHVPRRRPRRRCCRPAERVAWQRPDGIVCTRARRATRRFEQLRFCLGVDDDHTAFLRRFQQRPAARARRPAAARAAPAPARHRRPGAAARALRAADPRQRGARDGAADRPRGDGAAPTGCTRRRPRRTSRRFSPARAARRSACTPGAARRSSGSAARSTSSA